MLGVKKEGFRIALILGICIKFLDLSFLDKFTTILLILLSLALTILLLLALNAFKAELNDLVVFNKKKNYAAILLKP